MALEDSSYSDQVVQASKVDEGSTWAIGFIIFAGVLMMMSGSFSVFQGLAAVIEEEFFVLERDYAFDLDVTTWGWINVVTGVIVFVAGFLVFTGNIIARIIAIIVAMASVVTNFFVIPYFPIWAILIIALDIGIIWALTTHGRDFALDSE
jgi:hypothetical protein